MKISSVGFEALSIRLEVSSVGLEVSSVGLEVSSVGLEVLSVGLEVSSIGFEVSDSEKNREGIDMLFWYVSKPFIGFSFSCTDTILYVTDVFMLFIDSTSTTHGSSQIFCVSLKER